MKLNSVLSLTTLLAALAVSTIAVNAQGRGGGPGNFDPEQMRERMTQMMKERLNVSEDEWKVIEPRLEKVQEAQRSSMGGRFGGMGMWAGRGNRGGNAPQATDRPQRGTQRGDRPSMDEMQALRDAVEDEATPANELKAKMQALREARKKAEAELKTAREELRQVLTTRQEAALVLMGLLD